MGRPIIDIAGQRFGKLRVISRAESDGRPGALWLCSCQCGGSKIVRASHLRGGAVRSCGCLAKEASQRAVMILAQQRVTHGGSQTVEYAVWERMIQNCYSVSSDGWKYCGARHIGVYDRWTLRREGFSNFIADMGRKPSADLALRRIDKGGNFEPGNVTWGPRGRGEVGPVASRGVALRA